MDTNTAATTDVAETAPVETTAVDTPVPANDAPPTIPPGKTFIAFAYTAKDGNGAPVQRQARTFLAGTPDLFMQAQIEAVEGMIAESLGVEQPQITFFRSLVA